MKFRAFLQDPQMFFNVLQVCSKIQNGCLIQLHSVRTRFFTKVDSLDGVQLWVGCHTKSLFNDFRCDSCFKEQSITFEVLDMGHFIHCIRQAITRRNQGTEVKQLVMRLTRSGKSPILKLTMQGHHGLPDLSYDNPIRILKENEVESMQAPSLGDERLQVIIPSVNGLTAFVERLKNAQCEHVTFTAERHTKPITVPHPVQQISSIRTSQPSQAFKADSSTPPLATLVISAEHFLANFALSYATVEMIPQRDYETNAAQDEANDCGEHQDEPRGVNVTVDVKKLARFFSSVRDIISAQTSVYLVQETALVLSLYASNGMTMVAYIPAIWCR